MAHEHQADLVNMKIEPAAREKKYAEAATSPAEGNLYPWGLTLSLDDEALEKLGMEALPKADAKMFVYAKATVTRVESTDSAPGGKRRSVSLQITDLLLEPTKAKRPAADVLYPKD